MSNTARKSTMLTTIVLLAAWVCLQPMQMGATTATRRALVMGNDSYLGNRLVNARNDAKAMAAGLSSLGYVTTLLLDGGRETMSRSIETFVTSVEVGDTVLVYYAGHGFQVSGENYLVPTDFKAADAIDAKLQGYSLSALLDKLVAHGALTQVIILDACRDNPFGTVRGTQTGWAKTATSAGSFLAFGTSPGSTASDDPAEGHGLFTQSLLKFMGDSSLNIEELFQKVRREVILSSNASQVPWTASSLVGSFHIAPAGDANVLALEGASVDAVRKASPATQMRSVERDGTRDEVVVASDAELLREARSEMRVFHFEKAVGLLQALLSIDPRSALVMRLLAIALHLCGRDVEAGQLLDRAISLNGNDGEAYAYKCVVNAGHDINTAETACLRAIQICETCSLGHLGLAINLLAMGNSADAYAESDRAVLLSPKEPSFLSLRGRISASRGQIQMAERDYTRAGEIAAGTLK